MPSPSRSRTPSDLKWLLNERAALAGAGKYGKRGALREFVLGAVQSASPSPVATSAIVQGLASHFGLPAVTRENRYKLRMKVRGILRCARQEGLVQPLHERSGKVGLWVWASAPTLADLSPAATLLAGAGDDHNSNPHPI